MKRVPENTSQEPRARKILSKLLAGWIFLALWACSSGMGGGFAGGGALDGGGGSDNPLGGDGANSKLPAPGQPDIRLDPDTRTDSIKINDIKEICKNSSDQTVKMEIKGRLFTQSQGVRTLRVIDRQRGTFLNTQTDPAHHNKFEFTFVRGMQRLEYYLMPEDFTPRHVDEQRRCGHGACNPDRLTPISEQSSGVVRAADPDLPECPDQTFPEEEDEGYQVLD